MKILGGLRLITAVFWGFALTLVGCSTVGEPWQNITWEWMQATRIPDGTVFDVQEPGDYTIVFRPDGTFSGTADCNVMGGTYEWDPGGSFSIQPGPATLAFCGEGSVDVEYLLMLGEIGTWKVDEAGSLLLESEGGGVQMEFRNGGRAPRE